MYYLIHSKLKALTITYISLVSFDKLKKSKQEKSGGKVEYICGCISQCTNV